MSKKMIYHIPLPFSEKASSGSQLRPKKMFAAFKNIGYEIDLVSGYFKERKSKIKAIKKKIKEGEKYAFIYSESSTMPTELTEKHHLPTSINLDFSFFKFCKKQGIKTGLFYRDVYWLFPPYRKTLPFYKYCVSTFFYKRDIRNYIKYLDTLFVPCDKMIIPKISKLRVLNIVELPPGLSLQKHTESPGFKENKINIAYIGGISGHYNLDIMLSVLRKIDNLVLHLCCREFEYVKVKDQMQGLVAAKKIRIYHLSGDQISQIYQKADLALLFLEPDEYRQFMMPIKLFEYISFEKPILASAGTAASDFIKAQDIGWVLPYSEEAVLNFISDFDKLKAEYALKLRNIKTIKNDHLWESRARLAASILE